MSSTDLLWACREIASRLEIVGVDVVEVIPTGVGSADITALVADRVVREALHDVRFTHPSLSMEWHQEDAPHATRARPYEMLTLRNSCPQNPNRSVAGFIWSQSRGGNAVKGIALIALGGAGARRSPPCSGRPRSRATSRRRETSAPRSRAPISSA